MSDYDQFYLIPKGISQIRSRNDVSLRSDLYGLYPIISSPMAGVSGPSLVIEMAKNNCLGILHRFKSPVDRLHDIDLVSSEQVVFGISIQVNDCERELEIAEYAVEHGAMMVVLDLANAYIPQIGEMGKKLRNRLGTEVRLMTGNIITSEGASYVKESGFDFVRCSIGSGGLCTTRSVTGVGRNALAALKDCSNVDINLVVDGGIKNSGDIVKSFFCGADFAMLGSALALSNESENTDGKIFGMASRTNHENNGKKIKSIEGKDLQLDVSQKKPLKEILSEILWGIRSACTYLNCRSYKDIPFNSHIVNANESL